MVSRYWCWWRIIPLMTCFAFFQCSLLLLSFTLTFSPPLRPPPPPHLHPLPRTHLISPFPVLLQRPCPPMRSPPYNPRISRTRRTDLQRIASRPELGNLGPGTGGTESHVCRGYKSCSSFSCNAHGERFSLATSKRGIGIDSDAVGVRSGRNWTLRLHLF